MRIVFHNKEPSAVEPFEDRVEQLIHPTRSMASDDLLVQMPPDPLDRVRPLRVFRQGMQHDAIALRRQVDVHPDAVVKLRVVQDYVNRRVAPESTMQFFEVPHEQEARPVLALQALGQDYVPGLPVQPRAGESVSSDAARIMANTPVLITGGSIGHV